MAKDHRRLNAELAQEVLLDDPGFLRQIVEKVLQEMLEAEMTEHIGAAPYERSAARAGHRNGHERRALRTRVGTLNLLVPQDREGAFSTRPFSRYQRNEKALVLALMEMWRNRRLEAEAYPYLFVDARYEKVRVDGRVVSQGVLVVSGVRDDGFREILAVEVADTESEATYQDLFRSLKARGLKGVELAVSDDHGA
jgi:putative transposase